MTSSPPWPLCPGLHTCYNGRYKGLRNPRGGANPKKTVLPVPGLQAATRLHEAGIASNGRSERTAVNTFPGLVHTARHITKVELY